MKKWNTDYDNFWFFPAKIAVWKCRLGEYNNTTLKSKYIYEKPIVIKTGDTLKSEYIMISAHWMLQAALWNKKHYNLIREYIGDCYPSKYKIG